MFASWVFETRPTSPPLFHSAEMATGRKTSAATPTPRSTRSSSRASSRTDFEKRRTINRKLHAILAEDAAVRLLWTLTNYSAYHRKVRRVQIHPYKFFSFADEWFIPGASR